MLLRYSPPETRRVEKESTNPVSELWTTESTVLVGSAGKNAWDSLLSDVNS